ncbi:MAG: pyridoxal-phosphate dependent enzyme [Myxococcales bacterium]|nr:pyridoxal-phosphate dependent enzyme [Myxococcales bacterium]
MKAQNTILEAIGHTPLVKLRRLVGPDDAEIYAKCEYLNPSGSVKDRMARYILDRALESGELREGGLIVENTSGNTGAAVALWAAVNGIRCIFTIPDKMSQEKIDTLKGMGAEVVVCPTNVPADSPQSYYETAKRIHRETPGSYYINQYHNKMNIEAHYHMTGAEIWQQTQGEFDVYVAGLGTGGTMSGSGKYLKEKKPSIRNVGVDPIGSVYKALFETGKPSEPHVYKVEGIGEDMICGAMDMTVLDEIRQVDDRQSFLAARRIAREEGLFAGGSSGSAVHVAVELARELGKGKRIVVMLPDGGKSYISKFYSDEWMYDNGFMVRPEGLGTVGDVLAHKSDKRLFTATRDETLADAIARMREHDVSQLPVVNAAAEAVGMLHETDLLDALLEGRASKGDKVERVAQGLRGTIGADATVADLRAILGQKGLVAVVLDGVKKPIGLLTRIDLIEYLSRGDATEAQR